MNEEVKEEQLKGLGVAFTNFKLPYISEKNLLKLGKCDIEILNMAVERNLIEICKTNDIGERCYKMTNFGKAFWFAR